MEKTYTLEQIKKAFFDNFVGAGEVWFGDELNDDSKHRVNDEWSEFEEKFKEQ